MIRQTVLPFKLELTEEKITPNSGLIIYAELFKGIRLKKHILKHFPEPGSAKGFEAQIYVLPLLLQFLGGGKYIEDIRKIENDKAIRKIADLGIIPSPDAIGNWMRNQSKKKKIALKKLHKEVSRLFLQNQKRKSHTLDIDAFPIFANKYSSKMTYKGEKGYMPIVGHLAELDWCIGYELREGNIAPADRNYQFAIKCINNMPLGHKITKFRSDGAAYQAKIFTYLDKKGIKFTISGCKNKPMMEEILAIKEEEWKPLKNKNGHFSGRDYAETYAKMEHTDYFRIVVQRYPNPRHDLLGEEPETLYQVICTNYSKKQMTPKEIIKWHNNRGNSENYHKEAKGGFNLDYLPCDDFEANSIWFAIGMLAYNMHIFAKESLLPCSWRKKQIGSIRWQLIQIAGKIVYHGKVWRLRIAGVTKQIYELFKKARRRCWELSLAC